MAERAGAEADRCSRGPDHRGKRRHRNCAAQIPQDCESPVNLYRRHFLGSSLLVFGSTLMDALTTPLWRWKHPLLLDSKAASDTGAVQFVDVAKEAGLNVPNVWRSDTNKRYIIEANVSRI